MLEKGWKTTTIAGIASKNVAEKGFLLGFEYIFLNTSGNIVSLVSEMMKWGVKSESAWGIFPEHIMYFLNEKCMIRQLRIGEIIGFGLVS